LILSSRSADDNGSSGSASGSAPASGVDASIVALPYWSAFFGNAGTLALNPCGGIQNLHNDCPVDARGDPTNSFVQLRSAPAAAVGSAEHRAAHCVGWGTAASMRFESADDAHAGFKILLSGGTDDRSATLNFVCGRSTGEITAFAPSGDAAGSTATLTFVTKYACPKSADADAELERQRQKEADRKARQKLQQNYASLKQARLSPNDDVDKRPASAGAGVAGGAGAAAAGSEAGKQRKGFAKMRELGLHSAAASRSIDDMMEAERRKREQQQPADLSDDVQFEQSQQQPQQPQQPQQQPQQPPPQQQSQQSQQQPQQQNGMAEQSAPPQTVQIAKAFPGGVRRDGRAEVKKDPVSLDVYQQLLAKMREKAAKQGVSAEQAAHKSAQAQARVESDPIQLQLRKRDEAAIADVVDDDPAPPKLAEDDDAGDAQADRLAARHAAMRQAAQRYDAKNAEAVNNANELRRSLNELDHGGPRVRDSATTSGFIASLLASPSFGNQLLLVLLLLVASALGVAWYRVKAQENAAARAAAQRPDVFGSNSVPPSPTPATTAPTGGRVYEYDAVSDFEARSTKYTYERFVAELASKSNAPVTDADESEADDMLSNLLPPAPSSASSDAYTNGLQRRARSPESGSGDFGTSKND
jgi:hypothetical protein